MIAALLLVQAAAAPAPMPPQDWGALAPLRFVSPPGIDEDLSLFVRGEVAAGRCAAATRGADGWTLRVDMAVLVDPAGRVRRTVPRAIDCPTVEQFAVGALSRAFRDNVPPTGERADVWRKTSLSFAWSQ